MQTVKEFFNKKGKNMKINFEALYPGHNWITVNGKRIGELQRLPYGRKLWMVHINDIRQVFCNYDCFSHANAKRVARHFITGEKITLK